MKPILTIASGSGLGGALRYGTQMLAYRLYPFIFTFGAFMVNVIGRFLISIFFSLAEKSKVFNPETKLFLITGFCGGFTTFSAFSLDNISLLKSGYLLYFLIYNIGSILFSIMATLLGMYIVKTF